MSSIGPRRGPHPYRSSRPDDLVAVAFDDAVLDRLAARSRRATSRGCPRWVSDAVTGVVPDLFAQWQDRLVEYPAPEPIGADRAAELVAVHARRPSVRPAIAIAAAICALLVGSAVVGAKSARPGDPLFPVTQVLWSDQAQSAVAGEKVRSVINAARAELAAGRPDHAAALLREASSGLNGISDRGDQAAVRRDLTAAWTLLAAVSPRLAATVSVTGPAAGSSGAPAGVPGGAAAPQPVRAGAAAPGGSGTFSSMTEAALVPLGQQSGAGQRDASGPGVVAASGPGSSRGSGGATSAGASSKGSAPASGTSAHLSAPPTAGSPSSSTVAASQGASTSIAPSPTTASAPPAVPVESSPAAGSSVPPASSTAATPTPPPSTAGVAPSSTLPTGATPSSSAVEPSSPSVSNQAMILPGVPVVTVSGSATSGAPDTSSPGAPSPGSP